MEDFDVWLAVMIRAERRLHDRVEHRGLDRLVHLRHLSLQLLRQRCESAQVASRDVVAIWPDPNPRIVR